MGCCVAVPDATAHNTLSKKSTTGLKGCATCLHDRRRNRRARFAVGLSRTGFRLRLKRSRCGTSSGLPTNNTATYQQQSRRNSNTDEFILEPFDEPIGPSELLYTSQCANLDRLYSNYVRSNCGYNTYGSESSSLSSTFEDTSEDEEGNLQQMNEKGGGREHFRGENSKAQKELPQLIVATTTTSDKKHQHPVISISTHMPHPNRGSSSYQIHHRDEEYASIGGFAVGEKVMVQANIPAPKCTYYSGIQAPVSRPENRNINEVHVVGDPQHPSFMMHIASLTTAPKKTVYGNVADPNNQGWIQRVKPWQREQYAELVANVQQAVLESHKFGDNATTAPASNIVSGGDNSGLGDGVWRPGRAEELNLQHAEGLLGNPTTMLRRPTTLAAPKSPILTPSADPPPTETNLSTHNVATAPTNPSYLGKWRKVSDSLIGIASDTAAPSCSQTFSVLEDGGGAIVHRFTCPAAYGHTKDLPPFLSGLLHLLELFHDVDNYNKEGGSCERSGGGGLAGHLNDFFGQFPKLFPPLCLVTEDELTSPNDRLGSTIALSVSERRNLVLSRLSELIADAFIAAEERDIIPATTSSLSPHHQTASGSSDILPGYTHHTANNALQHHHSPPKHDAVHFLAESTEQALILLGQLTELGQPSIVIAEKQHHQEHELLQTSRTYDDNHNPTKYMEMAKCVNHSSEKRVSIVVEKDEQPPEGGQTPQQQPSVEKFDNSCTLGFPQQQNQKEISVQTQRPSCPSGLSKTTQHNTLSATHDSLSTLSPNMLNHVRNAFNPLVSTMAASGSTRLPSTALNSQNDFGGTFDADNQSNTSPHLRGGGGSILTPRSLHLPPLKDDVLKGRVAPTSSSPGGAAPVHSASQRKSMQGAAVSFSPAESMVVRDSSIIAGDVSELAGASFSAVTTTITNNGAIAGLESLASVPGYHTGTIIGIRDAVGTYGVYEMVTERLRSSASILHRRRRRRARRHERSKGSNSNTAVVLSPTKPNAMVGPPTLFGVNRSINNTMGEMSKKLPDGRLRLPNQQQVLPPTNVKTVAMPIINTASVRSGGVGGANGGAYPGANPLVPHSIQRAKTLQWVPGDDSTTSSSSSDAVIDDNNSSVSSGNLSTQYSPMLLDTRQHPQHLDTTLNGSGGAQSSSLLRGGASLWSVHAQPELDLISPLRAHPRFEAAAHLVASTNHRRLGVPKYGFMDGYTDNDNAASSDEEEGNVARLLLYADARRTSIDGKTVEGGPNLKSEKSSKENSRTCSISTSQQLQRRYSVNQQHSTFVPSATTDNRRHHRPTKSQWWIERKAGKGGAAGKLQSRVKISSGRNKSKHSKTRSGDKKTKQVEDPFANWDWCFQHYHDEAGERVCGVHIMDEFRSESSEQSILSSPMGSALDCTATRRMSRSLVRSIGTSKSDGNIIPESSNGGAVGRSTSLEQLSPPRFGGKGGGRRGSASGSNASPEHPSIYRQCIAKVILQKRNPTVVVQLEDGSVLEDIHVSSTFKLIHAAPPQGGRQVGDVPIPNDDQQGAVSVRPIVHTAKTRGGILLQRERLTHVLAFLDELSTHIVSRKFPNFGDNCDPIPPTLTHHQGSGCREHLSAFPPTPPGIMASPLSIVQLSQCLWENGCFVVGDRVSLSTPVGDFTGTVTYSWPRELSASSSIQQQQDLANRPIITPFCHLSMTPALIQFSIVDYHPGSGGPLPAFPSELPPQSPPRPRLGTVPPGHSGSLRELSDQQPCSTLESWLGAEEAEVMNLSNPYYDVGMAPGELAWDCVTQSMLEALISTLRLPDSSVSYDPTTGAATTPNVKNLTSASTLPQGASLGARPELENTIADHPEENINKTPTSPGGGGERKLSTCSSMFQAPLNDTKSSHLVPLFGPGAVCEASAVASVSTESTSIPNVSLTPVTEEVWSLRRYIIPLVFISLEEDGNQIESLTPKSSSMRVCIASDIKRNNNVPCSTLFSSIMTSPFLNPAVDDLTHSTDTGGAWMCASSSNTNNRRPSGGLHIEWSVGALITAFTERLRILVNLYLRAHPIVISIPRPLWPSLHNNIVNFISNVEPSKIASRPLMVFSHNSPGRLPKVGSFHDDAGTVPTSDASGTTAPDMDLRLRSGSGYSSGTFNPNEVSASSGSKRWSEGNKLTASTLTAPTPTTTNQHNSSPTSSQRAGTLRFIAEQAAIGRALPGGLNGGQYPAPYAPMHSELAIRAFRVIFMRMLRRMTHIMAPPQERRYSVHTLIGDHFQSVLHSDITLLDDD